MKGSGDKKPRKTVIPAEAGIQAERWSGSVDSRFRGNDGDSDIHSVAFAAEAHRQSQRVATSIHETEDQAFIEALVSEDFWR